MPVKSVGSIPVRAPQAAPAAPAAAAAPAPAPSPAPAPAPAAAAKPAGEPVGHGVTRLMGWRSGAGVNAPFIPGTPPPRGETAGAHGAHKGRISVR